MIVGLFSRKPRDPDVQAAYDQAYKEERIKVAAERGAAKAREKPFYQKLGGAVGGIGKGLLSVGGDIAGPAPKRHRQSGGDMLEFFMGSSDKPKRRVKKRRRRR